ncbi:MAG: hypothetical protein OXC09_06840 [Truepera sp.]|nr:hypothetical protein [Truepera sp.]
MTPLFDHHRRPLRLGPELGRGGEAVVYALSEDPGRAAKLYLAPDPGRAEKLELMIAYAPRDPAREGGHVAIAWPEALVRDTEGGVCGFTMPRLDLSTSLPLHQLYHPGTRRRRAPGINWLFLVRAARNLCAILATLHRSGYVVGDLNESNILIDDRALVTLVDLDSIQVQQRGRTYRCPVGKAEFTPPELLGRDFHSVTRLPRHDRFGLAVLIHLLLMEGVHPFAGVYRGEADPPSLVDNIAARRSPLLGSALLVPSPTAPSATLLPPQLRRLLRRALGGPPSFRPSAERWQQTLEAVEDALATCPKVPTHVYRRHLDHCPWCDRSEALGIDPFPGGSGPAPAKRTIPIPEAPPPLLAFRGTLRNLVRSLPLMTLLALAAPATVGGLGTVVLLRWLAIDWPPALALTSTFVLLLASPLAALATLYWAARVSPTVYRILRRSERAARSVLGASALAFAASLALGELIGSGSILDGDWLLLPSLWLLAFLIWRRFERADRA